MNLTLKERLDLQKTARIITEAQYNKLLKEEFLFEEASDEDIEKAVATALKISPDQVATQEPSEDEAEVNEIAITTLITIAGLVPPALNLVGSTINKAKQLFGLNETEKNQLNDLNTKIKTKEKYIKSLDKKNSPKEKDERSKLEQLIKQKDERFGTKLGNQAKHLGHDLHKAYTYPIRKFLDMAAWTSKKFGDKTKFQDESFREKLSNIMYAVPMAFIGGIGVIKHIGHLSGISTVAITIADGIKAGKSVSEVIKDAALLI